MSSQTTEGQKPQTMDEWLDAQFKPAEEPSHASEPSSSPAPETPAADTPADPAQAAPSAPPGAPVPPNWKLKLKEDGAETDLDVEEYVKDEAKRAEFVAWLQKGRQHEKVVERRLREQQQQTSDWLLSQMKAAGYTLAYDEKQGRLVVTPVNGSQPNTTGAAPNGAQGAADNGQTPDLTDPNQIRQRISALRPKVADGDAEAIAEVVDLQAKLADAVAAANTKPLREYVEHLKQQEALRAQEAAEATRKTIRERTLSAFKRHDATFAGLSEDQRITIAQGIAARLGPTATIEALEAQIDAWAQNEAQRMASRLQSAASPPSNGKGPAPSAPPVHGGRPPAAGGGSDQGAMPKSSFEAGWADRLIP